MPQFGSSIGEGADVSVLACALELKALVSDFSLVAIHQKFILHSSGIHVRVEEN
jgi:hypothetical protein